MSEQVKCPKCGADGDQLVLEALHGRRPKYRCTKCLRKRDAKQVVSEPPTSSADPECGDGAEFVAEPDVELSFHSIDDLSAEFTLGERVTCSLPDGSEVLLEVIANGSAPEAELFDSVEELGVDDYPVPRGFVRTEHAYVSIDPDSIIEKYGWARRGLRIYLRNGESCIVDADDGAEHCCPIALAKLSAAIARAQGTELKPHTQLGHSIPPGQLFALLNALLDEQRTDQSVRNSRWRAVSEKLNRILGIDHGKPCPGCANKDDHLAAKDAELAALRERYAELVDAAHSMRDAYMEGTGGEQHTERVDAALDALVN